MADGSTKIKKWATSYTKEETSSYISKNGSTRICFFFKEKEKEKNQQNK